ncbi:hypothetical protein WICANDRAFT_92840, partial [Wickerhamomyces anomalus NRRL Y-366-8]
MTFINSNPSNKDNVSQRKLDSNDKTIAFLTTKVNCESLQDIKAFMFMSILPGMNECI